MPFVRDLGSLLELNRNEADAIPMKAYMKNKFNFFGIKSVQRKSVLREAINKNKEEIKRHVSDITFDLYNKDEREFHYCAMEIYAKFKKGNYTKDDIEFIEFLITKHSHWDTVDFIAKHILGQFLIEIPEIKNDVINGFSKANNMWLNRAAILFQLGYKEKTDFKMLSSLCNYHKSSDEFFIRKAIGWALREYAKYNSKAVIDFVNKTELKPLSRKEALKHYS